MKCFVGCLSFLLVLTTLPVYAHSMDSYVLYTTGTDERPDMVWEEHNLGNLWSAFLNIGRFGDPDGDYFSMDWPGGSGSSYLWQVTYGLHVLVR